MNQLKQLEENVNVASDASPNSLTETDLALYSSVKSSVEINTAVPCTGCGYCMPCPFGVDIPTLFAAYNRRVSEGLVPGLQTYISCTSLKAKPTGASACRHCGKCETKCPQNLLIRDYLDETNTIMEGKLYHFMVYLLKKHPKLMKWMVRAL